MSGAICARNCWIEMETSDSFEEIPPRVEYSLAPRGEELIPALNDLYKWGLDQVSRK